MGYLGRRIGLSQDKGDSTPGGADGAVGGGILDLIASGYFQRQSKTFNAPGIDQIAISATGGVISDYTTTPGDIYRSHIFTSSGTFAVSALGQGETVDEDNIQYLVVAGGGAGGSGTNSGGGGGAGGFRTNIPGTPGDHTSTNPFPIATGDYTVTIGAGGATSTSSGSNSQFGPDPSPAKIISNGGGGFWINWCRKCRWFWWWAVGTAPGGAAKSGGATSAVTTPSPWPGPSTQGKAGGAGQHVPGSWEGGGWRRWCRWYWSKCLSNSNTNCRCRWYWYPRNSFWPRLSYWSSWTW